MTVQARSLHLALCGWMAEGRAQQGTFEMHALQRVPASASKPQPDDDGQPLA